MIVSYCSCEVGVRTKGAGYLKKGSNMLGGLPAVKVCLEVMWTVIIIVIIIIVLLAMLVIPGHRVQSTKQIGVAGLLENPQSTPMCSPMQLLHDGYPF